MNKDKVRRADRLENKQWRDARLRQANMNLTVPSSKKYKRAKAGARGRDW